MLVYLFPETETATAAAAAATTTAAAAAAAAATTMKWKHIFFLEIRDYPDIW